LNLTVEDIFRLSSFIPVLLFLSLSKEKNLAKQGLFYFFLFTASHSILYAGITLISKDFAKFFNLIYIPVEFILISLFFFNACTSKFYRYFIKYVSFAFLLIFTSSFILEKNLDFDSLINGIQSIVVITFSISFFYEHLKYPNKIFIDRDPFFWGVSAFLIFFSVSFFVFLFRETFWDYNEFYYQYVYVHAFSGILRNLICSLAFLIKPYKEKIPEFS
jgi:hypothetical protein